MPSKLIFAPITLLMGGWMFTSSFGTNTIQQSTTPYSTQQQIVEVEMPEPAKSFLRFGGAVIASVGTSSLVFWELASKKRSTQAQYLLAPSQNIVPNTVPVQINSQEMESLKDNHSSFLSTRIPNQIQKHSEEEEVEKSRSHEVTNFYQTGGQPSSISNYPHSPNNFKPQSSSEDKYTEVKSLVYENTVGIVGKEKGSGKTSKLGYLIAEHIKLGHLVWMVNPFAKGQQWKGIKVFGRGYKFVEATNAIREFTRIA